MISLALTISSDGFILMWLFQLKTLIVRKIHHWEFKKFYIEKISIKIKNKMGKFSVDIRKICIERRDLHLIFENRSLEIRN